VASAGVLLFPCTSGLIEQIGPENPNPNLPLGMVALPVNPEICHLRPGRLFGLLPLPILKTSPVKASVMHLQEFWRQKACSGTKGR